MIAGLLYNKEGIINYLLCLPIRHAICTCYLCIKYAFLRTSTDATRISYDDPLAISYVREFSEISDSGHDGVQSKLCNNICTSRTRPVDSEVVTVIAFVYTCGVPSS